MEIFNIRCYFNVVVFVTQACLGSAVQSLSVLISADWVGAWSVHPQPLDFAQIRQITPKSFRLGILKATCKRFSSGHVLPRFSRCVL